jgi:uncharacterized protein YidB (DUF937 family)
MGIMDLAGQFLGDGQGGGTPNPLLNSAIGLIQNHPGGLQGLLGKLQESGLGAEVASWVGSGENLPVSADQIRKALGADQVEALGQQAGVSPEHAGNGLAALLPELISKLTPAGQVAQEGSPQEGLGGLLGKMLG